MFHLKVMKGKLSGVKEKTSKRDGKKECAGEAIQAATFSQADRPEK